MNRLLGICAVTAAAWPCTALAADKAPDPQNIVKLACQQGGVISSELLAEAVLIESGIPPSTLLATLPATSDVRTAYLSQARAIVNEPDAKRFGAAKAFQIVRAAEDLVEAYNTGALKKLIAISGAPIGELKRPMLFGGSSSVTVSCVAPAIAVAGGAPTGKEAPRTGWQPRLLLRKSVDDLTAASEKGIEGAGSFSFGFTRTKSTTDAGADKVGTDLQINGAAALTIGSARSGKNTSLVYAEYTRSEKRSRLTPPPATPEDQSKDDVDVLDVGFAAPSLATLRFANGGMYAELRGRTGWVGDFAKNSRRIYANLQFEPGFPLGRLGRSVGYGAYGSEISLGFTSFRLRARAWGEAELSHVIRAGTSKLNSGDELFGLGGTVRLDLVPRAFAKHGPIGSVQYRRLWMVSGTAESLGRLDVEAGYRFLIDSRLAIDLKGSYALGEERKSYDEQDIFKLEVGLKL